MPGESQCRIWRFSGVTFPRLVNGLWLGQRDTPLRWTHAVYSPLCDPRCAGRPGVHRGPARRRPRRSAPGCGGCAHRLGEPHGGCTRCVAAQRGDRPSASRTVGKPRVNLPTRPGSVFSYPNRGKKKQVTIRKRVLNTIKSTWGGPRGTLWSRSAFQRPDPDRHVDVRRLGDRPGAVLGPQAWRERPGARGQGPQQAPQAVEVAAQASPPHALPARGTRRRPAGGASPGTATAPVGAGAAPHHSKYFLFTNVGAAHVRSITMQTSMNLTRMGLRGPVEPRDDHLALRACTGRSAGSSPSPGATGRRPSRTAGSCTARCRASSSRAPAPPLATTRSCVPSDTCSARTHLAGGDRNAPHADPDHPVRDVQRPRCVDREAAQAPVERGLQHQDHLRRDQPSRARHPALTAGRGPIPMRQSVIRNAYGEIVKYNHSKWMTITGHWGSSRRAYVVFPGSSNWGNLAFSSDEQIQQIRSYAAHACAPGRVHEDLEAADVAPAGVLAGVLVRPDVAGRRGHCRRADSRGTGLRRGHLQVPAGGLNPSLDRRYRPPNGCENVPSCRVKLRSPTRSRWDNHGFIHGGTYDQPPDIRFSRRADRTGVHDRACRSASGDRQAQAASGKPPGNSVVCTGSYFSYPNRSSSERTAIRNRVVNTINSHLGQVRRRRRGAARQDQHDHLVLQRLGRPGRTGRRCEAGHHRSRSSPPRGSTPGSTTSPGSPCGLRSTRRLVDGRASDPDQHRAAVRRSVPRRRGHPHSKYFLFDDVGSSHQRNIVVQTSMNLTQFAFRGQWNQATASGSGSRSTTTSGTIFNQSSKHRSRGSKAYVRRTLRKRDRHLLPGRQRLARPRHADAEPGALQGRHVRRHQRPDPGPGHPVRHPRHARQRDRQEAARPVERRLRRADHLLDLQPPGAQDPALTLRPRPDPDEAVRHQEPQGRDREVQPQQVARDLRPLRRQPRQLDGARRVGQLERPRLPQRRADAAVVSATTGPRRYFTTFSKTWGQSTSKPPRFGRMAAGTGTLAPQEVAAEQEALEDVPEQPTCGKGIYKYMPEGG